VIGEVIQKRGGGRNVIQKLEKGGMSRGRGNREGKRKNHWGGGGVLLGVGGGGGLGGGGVL